MKNLINFLLVTFLSVFNVTCAENNNTKEISKVFNSNKENEKSMENNNSTQISKTDTAIFAAGCFWCVEAVFQLVNGVKKVESGYIGGDTKNPTYKDICTGTTNHAEAIRITFDSSVISFDELLEIFWTTHDPTTLNRQGNDIGTQYRSAVFYLSDAQKDKAQYYKDQLNKEQTFGKNVVTEITKASDFYIAEDYHQNYYNQNKSQPYCSYVITPKIEKLNKVFKHKLK